MIVTRHFLAAPLNAYIDFLYSCEGPAPYPCLKVLPMSSFQLMINFGAACYVHEASPAGPALTCAESWSVGLWNSYHVMELSQDVQLLCVSFKPVGAYAFFRLPLSELHNQIVSLDTLWGHWAAEVREQLYTASSMQARVALLQRLLQTRLHEAPYGLKTIQYAVEAIQRQHGVLSIRTLSNQLGISQKHLITQFKQLAGGTPKELARNIRFRDVLFSLDPTQPIEWSQVAYQHGYCDQSHLNQDFTAFTGDSPTEYLRLFRQIYSENPQLGRQHLPTG